MMVLNNKKGFSLMELLLSITVLALISALFFPTFFGGGKEALKEARKSTMMSAFQNTLSGAQIMLSIAYSKDLKIIGDLEENQTDLENKNLSNYCSMSTRVFRVRDNVYVFGAKMNTERNGVEVYYSEGTIYTPSNAQRVGITPADLESLWQTLYQEN